MEQIEFLEEDLFGLRLACFSGVAQVLDQRPWVDLLLYVDRQDRDLEVLAVALVLALPDELRVQGRITRPEPLARLSVRNEPGQLGGREVRAVVIVLDRLDPGTGAAFLLVHGKI